MGLDDRHGDVIEGVLVGHAESVAQALGVDANPRTGGKDGDVVYLIYPDSGNSRLRELKEIVVNAKQLFDAWGGLDRLNACVAREQPK